MSCQITISPPIGGESFPGQGLTSLKISGTAVDCSEVKVHIKQTIGVGYTIQKNAEVVNDLWNVEFTIAAGDFDPGVFNCGSNNKYIVTVVCADDTDPEDGTSCGAKLVGAIITCGNCPEANLTITPHECVDGLWTVDLRADVLNTDDATYTWFFGTDEDNQPGEDSQAGDGNGNTWLPAPDANGIRTVTTQHVYDPTGDQPQTITVKFETSTGPDSACTVEKTFELHPCECKLKVSLEVWDVDEQSEQTAECLSPGDYIVKVTEPVDENIDYVWSVGGVPNNEENGPAYPFSIAAGEEKTISVAVTKGGCLTPNSVTVSGCEDCSTYDVQLKVFDNDRRDVTAKDCLPAGEYTVQASTDPIMGSSFKWWIDDEVVTDNTGSSIPVTLTENDQKLVSVEATRGVCSDYATEILETCTPEIIDDEEETDGFIPCLLFKILALLGLGLVFVGAVLLFCPLVAAPFPPQVALAVGGGLLIGGGLLLGLGLLLWTLICQPDWCDWQAFLWQSLVLLGVVMIYAGFCPACSWMLLGIIPLIIGAWGSIYWGRTCNVSRCGVLSEWISLFTFVVNVVVILEMVLAACVITSQTVPSVIWGSIIAGFQAWLWWEANQANCIRA